MLAAKATKLTEAGAEPGLGRAVSFNGITELSDQSDNRLALVKSLDKKFIISGLFNTHCG
jgi:hypothetical protein